MAPFWSALFWGAVLAFASWPLMRLLTRWLNGRESLAAAMLTLGWMLLVAVPLVWLGFNLADHVRDAVAFIKDVQVDGLPEAPPGSAACPWWATRLVGIWNSIDQQGAAMMVSLKPYLGQVGNWLLARSADRQRHPRADLEHCLRVLFLSGRAATGGVCSWLAGAPDRQAGGVLHRTGGGHGATGGERGDRDGGGPGGSGADRVPDCRRTRGAGAGYRDLPAQPDSHGPAAGVDSGHGLAGLEGEYGMAVFLGIWGTFIISGVDNVLKPYLISRGGNLPLVIVLLGVFGGLIAFGFIGLFIGPTLLAVAYSLLTDWSKSHSRVEDRR
jgi:predicted PurR-regulated permease PerM